MAAKITCPECDKTLTLAKAPAPGKKVRCPRCQAVFIAVPGEDGELAEDESPAPQQKSAVKKGGPAKSSPKPAAPPPPAPKKPAMNEDEDSTGTYGFAMSAEEEEEREKTKPKIDYAPDLTVKDPRGKAVAILAKPSTLLITDGGLIALAGLLAFSAAIWPFFFANTVADTRKAIEVSMVLEKQIKSDQEKRVKGGSQSKKLKEKILKEEDPEAFAELVDPLIKQTKPSEEYIRSAKPADLEKEDKVAFKIWQLMEERATTFHIWMIVVSIPVLLYGGVMAFAGVKMQTLESHPWSLVGTVMGIIFGIGATIALIILLFSVLEEDEPGIIDYLLPIFGILFNLGGIAASVWGLRTVLDPKIKEAFFFDPEKDVYEEEAAEEDEEEEDEEEEEEDEE